MIYMFRVIHHYLMICLRLLEINVLKYMNLILLILYQHLDQHKSCLKKAGIELELLTNIELLLMVEKGIRESICHAIHRYTKAKKKYMKNYHKNKESSYLQYLDASNLYGWLISQKLPLGGLKWKKCMLKFN